MPKQGFIPDLVVEAFVHIFYLWRYFTPNRKYIHRNVSVVGFEFSPYLAKSYFDLQVKLPAAFGSRLRENLFIISIYPRYALVLSSIDLGCRITINYV
jgi:hypothetical protein